MVTSDKEKLIGLNLDYFIVDFKTVYLGIPKVTRVRELFHEQFNKQEIMRLLETHGWNQKEAVNFVLKMDMVKSVLQEGNATAVIQWL